MSIVAERYGLCHRIREVSPTLSAMRDSPHLTGPDCEPPHADHVLGDRAPCDAQPGAVRQPKPSIERVHAKTVFACMVFWRTRRVVASGPGAVLRLPGACRQPAAGGSARDVCCVR